MAFALFVILSQHECIGEALIVWLYSFLTVIIVNIS